MEYSYESLISVVKDSYYGFLVLLILLTLLWYVWKRANRYAGLPAANTLLFEVVYQYFANRSKNLPFTNAMLRRLELASKQFEKEGMYYFWCFRPALVIFGEEGIKAFSTDEASSDKSFEYEIIKDAIGEGLITSNGEVWKKDRKMLNCVFRAGMLKDKISVLNENANILVKKLEEVVDKPTSNLVPSLKCCIFHNLCESILDINVKETVSDSEVEELFALMAILGEYMTISWLFPATFVKVLKLCTLSGWRYLRFCRKLRGFGDKILSQMYGSLFWTSRDLNQVLDQDQKSTAPILLGRHLKDPSFTWNRVQDHVYTLVTAGSDTVLYTTMWSLFLLGLHKDEQEKVYDEIQSVTSEFISYEDLCKMEYLDCVLKETLRLYPAVPLVTRYLKKDKQCGKYTIPKGTIIAFFLYSLHRNSEIYSDSGTFHPERFLSKNMEKKHWAHLPFAEEGYRNCIGKKFAMMEMKIMLAYILRNYEITSLDKIEDVDLAWNFLLMPVKPLRMRLTPRKVPAEVLSKSEH